MEDDFLQQTYCTSGALSQYALVSKELLQARYATVFENDGSVSASPAANKKGVSPELTQDVVAASLSRRPILLVGDVGVGKSIFIRYLIKVAAKEPLERALVLYIDFGTKPALASDLRSYVVQEIDVSFEMIMKWTYTSATSLGGSTMANYFGSSAGSTPISRRPIRQHFAQKKYSA